MSRERTLTWNQQRALDNLSHYPDGATPRQLADPFAYFHPYLCGASARSAVMALVRKGLAEVSSAGAPMRYRLTAAGRSALAEGRTPSST